VGIETIIAAVAAAGSLFGGLRGAGVFGGNNSPAAPTITPPAAPPGPAADLSPDAIAAKRPAAAPAPPSWLGIDPNMTPLQQRAKIATLGTNSNDSRYTDSATRDYYKNLLLTSYNPQSGLPGGVLPQESQYASNVLGAQPRQQTAESLISAILRG